MFQARRRQPAAAAATAPHARAHRVPSLHLDKPEIKIDWGLR